MSATLADATAGLQAHFDARRSEGVPTPVLATIGLADLRPGHDAPGWSATANVLVSSREILVGPWPFGADAGCARCLAIRWQRLRERFVRDALELGTSNRTSLGWPATPRFLADAVWSAYLLACAAPPSDRRRVTALNVADLTISTVVLLPDAQCPSCAAPSLGPSSGPSARRPGFELVARPKAAPQNYRLRSPDDFDLDEEALANPVCGAIGLRSVIDLGCPTVAPVNGGIATRNAAKGLVGLGWGGQTHRHATSRRVGMLEGLERYAGAHQRRADGRVLASYAELGARALDPAQLGLYPAATVRRDARLTPWDPHRVLPWVAGWSLRDDREVLVPEQIAYFASPGAEDCFLFGSSNGCASGSCREEATLHGLLEVIERDAFLLGWYGGLVLPEFDLSACADPQVTEMVRRADLAGHDVRVFDNRIDLPIPVATAVAVRRDGQPAALSFAAGASPSPIQAVRAAVGEAILPFLGMAEHARERAGALDAMAEDYGRVVALHDHSDLFTLPRMREHAAAYLRSDRPRATIAGHAWNGITTDLRTDLEDIIGALAQRGFDVVVVEQSSPEQQAAGVHTVNVLVPGLVPIDFGWHNQRALTSPRLRSVLAEHGDRFASTGPHVVPHPFP